MAAVMHGQEGVHRDRSPTREDQMRVARWFGSFSNSPSAECRQAFYLDLSTEFSLAGADRHRAITAEGSNAQALSKSDSFLSYLCRVRDGEIFEGMLKIQGP